ncbi:MAG TPA: TraR/DksA C4-type zinc finger protein [Nocardioides sp.]|jgi:RNA polymerase-binding transcription factor|nr:TraR/DksA C4-type zinc finger protein [Nocardioides sp.]
MHEDAAEALDRQLAEREERLEAELAQLTKPPGELGAISFGKRVGEGTSMAVDRLAAVSAQEHLLAMLEEVRRARARIADGTYGTCEVCGEPIPEGRLEARPWATRCLADS